MRSRRAKFLTAICAWASLAGHASAQEAKATLNLSLVCTGTLETMEQQRTSVSVSSHKDATDSASGTSTTFRAVRVPARFSFVFADGSGRVRIPRVWTPVLGKRSSDGWYPLEEFTASDTSIGGRLSLGLISKPRLHIDRRTGASPALARRPT